MIEARVEEHLCTRVADAGGEVRKLAWLGRRGAPDRAVMLPDGHAREGLSLIELKRPKGQAEAHQAREHARLRKYKVPVFVLTTKAEVDEWMGGGDDAKN